MADLATLAQPQPVVLGLPVDAPTLDRLHGLACLTCGAIDGLLVPADHDCTASGGGRLGWAVVACADHQGAQRPAGTGGRPHRSGPGRRGMTLGVYIAPREPANARSSSPRGS
jgi:hypothetical protein